MHRKEKTLGQERLHSHAKTPSFSSSLLEKIYRSIDEGDRKSGELKFSRDTMGKKHNRGSVKYNKGAEEEELAASSFRRAGLLDKWREETKASEKLGTKHRYHFMESDRKWQHHCQDVDHDQDVMFFSSTSSSSDSSSGGLSSSDTEFIYRQKSTTTCFGPLRPKPVRTTVPARSQRSGDVERRQNNLFYKQRELHQLDYYHNNSLSDQNSKHDESLLKSKSRALNIYNNLKKVKQPISPGGRLTSFLNSLFTTGNTKKTKSKSSVGGCEDSNSGRRLNSSQDSTCSSASSFSRSCLSKHSPATREKLPNGMKRTVRFYPVSVIVDEDSRPCGHKSLYKEEEDCRLLSVSVPTAWKTGRSPSGKIEDDHMKLHVVEKSRRAEAAAKEFLKDCHQSQKNNDLILRNLLINTKLEHEQNDDHEDEDEDDDEDAESCSSSDLFELDHLSVVENHRYCKELPVYETTHLVTNRAIANGLIG